MITNAPPNLTRDLSFLLAQASHALATEMTAALAGLGIPPRAYCVLSTAMTGEFTQNHLAELCALDKTTMVVTIDALERAGLAERRVLGTDRRARVILVTEAGERAVAEGKRIVDRVHEDVLAALPAREREAFVDGLERLVGGRLSTPVDCDQPVRRRVPRSPKVGP